MTIKESMLDSQTQTIGPMKQHISALSLETGVLILLEKLVSFPWEVLIQCTDC